MEGKRNTLMVVMAISALFVVAGILYIWSFSTYFDGVVGSDSDRIVLSPFDTSQGVQLSPDECVESCPYDVEILCKTVWKC